LDRVYINRLPDDKDDISKNTTNKDIATNQNNSTIKYNISIEKNHLDSLDPKFKNSIEEFIRVLNGHLDDAQVSKDQKKLLEKQIEGLALEIKNIPPYKKIQDNPKTDFTQSINKNKDGDIECCDKVIEINPQNADAYYNKAQALSTIEKYAEAIEYYDKALELESDNVNALNKKAWFLVNHFPKRLNEASETIKKAIGLDPTNNNIMYTYGYTLDKLKTYEEAILVYEHIIKQKPSFSNVWYDCARSKIKLDDKDIQSCIYNLQKAIELNPDYKEKAKHEIDFQDIRNYSEFKKILESNPQF
jgi:tetratricopeptide (TPR) repeat protein